jgi:hypothetical protein
MDESFQFEGFNPLDIEITNFAPDQCFFCTQSICLDHLPLYESPVFDFDTPASDLSLPHVSSLDEDEEGGLFNGKFWEEIALPIEEVKEVAEEELPPPPSEQVEEIPILTPSIQVEEVKEEKSLPPLSRKRTKREESYSGVSTDLKRRSFRIKGLNMFV